MAELLPVLTSHLLPALGWSLLHFLWQGLLIGWGASLALHLLRNARPQTRYALACAALLLCVALPLGGTVWRVADMAAGDTGAVLPLAGQAAAALQSSLPGGLPAALPVLADADQLTAWEYVLRRQLPWLVLLWAAGAALMTLRLSIGLMWVRERTLPGSYKVDADWQQRLDRLAERIGLRTPVRLGVSDNLDGPMTAGCWKPIVLLPASLISGMPPDLLEALLAHELAHIRRHDYLVNLVQSAIEIVLFYHPSVWTLSHRIRAERELIADDLAATALGAPRRLALALSELDRFQFAMPPLAHAAHGGNLMSRIKRLVRPSAEPLSWKIAAPLLGLCAACVALYAHAAPQVEPEAAAARSSLGAPSPTSQAAAAQAEAQAAWLAASETERSARSAAGEAEREARKAASEAGREARKASIDAERAARTAAAEAGRTARQAAREASNAAGLERSYRVPPVSPVPPMAAVAPALRALPAVPAVPAAPAAPAALAAPAAPAAPPAPVAPVAPAAPLALEAGSAHIIDHAGESYIIVRAGRDRLTGSGQINDWKEASRLKQTLKSDFTLVRKDGKAYVISDPAVNARIDEAWKPVDAIAARMDAQSAELDKQASVMEKLGDKMSAAVGPEPTREQQAAMRQLERRMDVLASQQERIGGRMEALGNKMSDAQSAEQRERLNVEMQRLQSQFAPLNAEMQKLAQEMGKQASRQAVPQEAMRAMQREMEAAGQPMKASSRRMAELGREQGRASRDAERAVRSLIRDAIKQGQAAPAPASAATKG